MGNGDMHLTGWIHIYTDGDTVGLQKSAYLEKV